MSRRFLALVLDVLVVSPLVFTLHDVFAFDFWVRTDSATANAVLQILPNIAFYHAINLYPLATRGQSIGKLALGIKIVNATDGRVPRLAKIVFLRSLPFQAAAVLPAVGYLFVWCDILSVLRKDRRCLHDLAAGTRVVVVER